MDFIRNAGLIVLGLLVAVRGLIDIFRVGRAKDATIEQKDATIQTKDATIEEERARVTRLAEEVQNLREAGAGNLEAIPMVVKAGQERLRDKEAALEAAIVEKEAAISEKGAALDELQELKRELADTKERLGTAERDLAVIAEAGGTNDVERFSAAATSALQATGAGAWTSLSSLTYAELVNRPLGMRSRPKRWKCRCGKRTRDDRCPECGNPRPGLTGHELPGT